MEQEKGLLIIGHRGASGDAPENTLISFQKAVEEGAHGIELDVHLSNDGRLVICHDDEVDRTTNGTGRINDLSYEELRQLDAGAWFDPQFAGERLPLLEEVFELVPEHLLINVEIKGSYDGKTGLAVARMLDAEGRRHRVIVSSFDHQLLLELKRNRPETEIGLLYDTLPESQLDMIAPFQVEQLTVTSIHPWEEPLESTVVQELHQSGYEIYPFTANTEADWKRLIEAGVSGIITDYPGRLLAYLQRTGDKH